MIQGRLRAVLTTLIPILNHTRGSLAACISENIPHHRSNPAAFLTAVRHFSSSSCSSSRRHHGSISVKGEASARSSVPLRPSLRRPLGYGNSALERGSAAGCRTFSTPKRPATQLGAEATTAAASAGDRGAGLTMDDAREALTSLFGHDDFRDGQVRCRAAIANWCTVLALVRHAFQSMFTEPLRALPNK